MKKLGLALAVAAMATIGAGCYGTKSLTRSVDDWGNQMYKDSPWLAQPVGWIAVPVAMFVTGIIDGVVDTYYFWSADAWDGEGTPYMHKAVK